MAEFDPAPNEVVNITLGATQMQFFAVPNPAAVFLTHAIEGRKAVIFQLRLQNGKGDFALKVMKPAHRLPALVPTCDQLARLRYLQGMQVCERYCLTQSATPAVIKLWPDLEFSILMPWIKGSTWSAVLGLDRNGPPPISDRYAATRLATSLVEILDGLERKGLAHCDLSAQNVIVDAKSSSEQLIDVEDLFGPGFTPPSQMASGSPGYQHHTSGQGQWSAEADRFAGAILISEMLTAHDAAVRAVSSEESYFDPGELQELDSRRFQILVRSLAVLDSRLPELLTRAWQSQSLSECPRISEWKSILLSMDDGIPRTPFTFESEREVSFVPFEMEGSETPKLTWREWGEEQN